MFYKFKKNLIFIAAVCLIILFGDLTNRAQEIEAKIKITPSAASPARVRVEGKLLNPQSSLASRDVSFLQNYADVSELGTRIENLNLFDEKGEKLEVKKFIAGEFQTSIPAVSFEYDVKTDVPSRLTAAAHVSWLSDTHGFLMLNDLLPQWKSEQPISGKITLEVPSDWKINTSETLNSNSTFDVRDIENAVFLVGTNWREKTARIDKTNLNLVLMGEWQFSDDEALKMARSILEANRKIFGKIPVQKTAIYLIPFPQQPNQPDRWRAETRGANVLVLSGIMPFKTPALQRLQDQLSHEIFHLWLPNGLALKGNYDWFYEGFTIYQALRTSLRMNGIRFTDYLNTLGRAFDSSQNQNISLIEVSNKRWAGGNGALYSKGMLAAFLCDAALVRASEGKRSLTDVFREIYQKHATPNIPQEGNAAILSILKNYPELHSIIENYIEGTANIEWQNELNAFGIEAAKQDSGTKLRVLPEVGGRQKDLLKKLGYNQSLDASRK